MPPTDLETLVLYDVQDPPTLDPARSWGVLDGTAIHLIFSNLVRFDHQAHIQPDLARSWTISDDGQQYNFHLNSEARFAFGRPVTAEDVRYSFARVLDPQTASPTRWVLERIRDMEIPDPYTISFHLSEPFTPFLQMLAMPAAAIVPQEEVEKNDKIPFGERPVGSGPWRLEDWQHDQFLLFKRNELYWARKPHLQYVKILLLGNPFTAIAEFETGNVSVIDPLPEVEILRWKSHPQWKSFTQPTQILTTDMLVFNCERSPLDQAEVRQALCRAVETPLVLECARQGAGTPGTGPIPPGLTGYSSNRKPYPYEPEKSRADLQRLIQSNRELTLLLPVHEGFIRTTCEIIQAEWKAIGIQVRLQQTEWVTYRRLLREGQFDVAFRSWFADYPDGDNFLFPLFHSSQIEAGNMSHFRDAEIDDLIERSQRELHPEARNALLCRANELVFDRAPALFLWYRGRYTVRQPWLKGFTVPLIFNGTQYLDERIEPPDLR